MEKQIRLTSKESIRETLLADVVAVFAEWENNWRESDFEQAFKESRLGWQWLFDKFVECDEIPSLFYACLDISHQQMLVSFLFEEKFKGLIQQREINRMIFKDFSGEDPENEE